MKIEISVLAVMNITNEIKQYLSLIFFPGVSRYALWIDFYMTDRT
ncbi:hypothetical protein OAC89_06570 [Deltaproteobacteria bacterium]|nr:hypothetical protein [Deltaproteobacteria bacterium]